MSLLIALMAALNPVCGDLPAKVDTALHPPGAYLMHDRWIIVKADGSLAWCRCADGRAIK